MVSPLHCSSKNRDFFGLGVSGKIPSLTKKINIFLPSTADFVYEAVSGAAGRTPILLSLSVQILAVSGEVCGALGRTNSFRSYIADSARYREQRDAELCTIYVCFPPLHLFRVVIPSWLTLANHDWPTTHGFAWGKWNWQNPPNNLSLWMCYAGVGRSVLRLREFHDWPLRVQPITCNFTSVSSVTTVELVAVFH